MFVKMPIAWLSGLKIISLDQNECTVSIPYKRLTQNPFHSVYFASQAMAAEMSTGYSPWQPYRVSDRLFRCLWLMWKRHFTKS